MSKNDKYLIYEIPIKTVEQAKDYFRQMGCSHFHMGREAPDRYNEYRSLNISKETEKEWTQEQFEEYYKNILENTDANSLSHQHSSMENLLYTLKSKMAWRKMLEVTQFIHDKVPAEYRVIIAETTVGRAVIDARDGLIFKAFDSDQKDIAKKFCELALHFSGIQEHEMDESKIGNLYGNNEMILRVYKQNDFRSIYSDRCRKATQRCNEIKRILGL
jgi:tRNA-dihydrouridine synthase